MKLKIGNIPEYEWSDLTPSLWVITNEFIYKGVEYNAIYPSVIARPGFIGLTKTKNPYNSSPVDIWVEHKEILPLITELVKVVHK